jgi:hypothetical protein
MRRVVIFLISVASLAIAQQQVQQMQVARRPARQMRREEPKMKLTPEQQQRAAQMLEGSIAEARGIEATGGRAFALLQVARALQNTDKKQALELLEEALASVRSLDEDSIQTKDRLQRQILRAYVALAPERADGLLDELDVSARKEVLNSLLSYYESKKQQGRALEVIYRIGQESELPYGAAARLIAGMKAERSSDAQQLFAAALASYRTYGESRRPVGPESFSDMITRTWEKLPPGLVKAGIDEVLAQAEKEDKESDNRGSVMTMVGNKGGVEFKSSYEVALFQLAPILKKVAPADAESRLRQSQSVRENLGRFPDGMRSVMSPPESQPGTAQGGNAGMMMMSTMHDGGGGGGGRTGPPAGMPAPAEMMLVSQAMEEADKDPQAAMNKAAAISNPGPKVDAYIGIARITAKKNPSIARQALEKALDLPLEDTQRASMRIDDAAQIYLQIDDIDNAKKAVEKQIDAAEKAYRADSNGDDPNKALKAYWPSTEAYRAALRNAARISPDWAQTLLKEISDPEVRTLNQIALASVMLDVPPGPTTIITQTKNDSSIMSTEMAPPPR